MSNHAVLSFDGVSINYSPSGPWALRDVSFSVSAGERVALVGPSGAGKTTILSAANGLVAPTEGRVRVHGTDTASLGREGRRAIGSIPQGNALVGSLRVAQNVASGRLGYLGPVETLRELVRPRDTEDIVAILEQVGIPEKLWDRADQLSGGQQQRVAIARTLYQKPDLILADEPVSALDPARSDAVMEILTEAVATTPGRALVTSMHDAPLALKHCDRIIALRRGEVLFDAPSESVTEPQLAMLYELES